MVTISPRLAAEAWTGSRCLTKPRENLPVSVPYKGRDVMIYTFQQIDRIGKKALKERAMNMRDLGGADNLPRFSPRPP